MHRKIFNIIKKIVFSFILIYTFNIIVMPLNIIIGINFISLSLITILGVPGLLLLIGGHFII